MHPMHHRAGTGLLQMAAETALLTGAQRAQPPQLAPSGATTPAPHPSIVQHTCISDSNG